MSGLLAGLGIERWILPTLLLWPLAGALLVGILGRDRRPNVHDELVPVEGIAGGGPDARVPTLAVLLVEAVLGVLAWLAFDPTQSGWQFRVDVPWLPDLGARLSLGIDGISLAMLVLTTLLLPLALIATWRQITSRLASYGALLLALTSGLVGVFTALDLLLFYLAWELMLIPMYFIIGIWGGAARSRAATKYVILTMLGSLLMLVAIVALYVRGGSQSFHLDELLLLSLDQPTQLWLFGAFFLAFAIKSALVPFHTWLPDAQFEAPVIAAVVLGLKVGTYAILRFAIPLFPAAATHETVRTVVLVLSVVAILWGALVAAVQPDLRRVLSYSSISHLGFIMLGSFVLTQASVEGAVMIMINHGITTSALFLLAGFLRESVGSDRFDALGGIARVAPLFAAMLTLAMLSTIALPGTNGFVGEFLVLIGSYERAPIYVIISTVGVVLAAVYALRAVQRILFGELDQRANGAMADLGGARLAVMVTFAIAIIWIGVAPAPLLHRLAPASRALVQRAEQGSASPSSASFSVAPQSVSP